MVNETCLPRYIDVIKSRATSVTSPRRELVGTIDTTSYEHQGKIEKRYNHKATPEDEF